MRRLCAPSAHSGNQCSYSRAASGTCRTLKGQIFLSYSRKDMVFADQLEAALTVRGFDATLKNRLALLRSRHLLSNLRSFARCRCEVSNQRMCLRPLATW